MRRVGSSKAVGGRRARRSRLAGVLLFGVLVAVYYGLERVDIGGNATATPGVAAQAVRSGAGSDAIIVEAFRTRRSDVVVESTGVVDRVLRDDLEGSRHQRFVLRLDSGHRILIAHNIDLAPRVDALVEGDSVSFRGEYEWNERGGVVHWTHHDPAGRRPGGFLEHAGRRYR